MEALIPVAETGGPTMLARIGVMRSLYRVHVREFTESGLSITGAEKAQEGRMTVFVYVSNSRQIGDVDHIKVFANQDAAETWFAERSGRRCVRA
jgi:hypothetical protein